MIGGQTSFIIQHPPTSKQQCPSVPAPPATIPPTRNSVRSYHRPYSNKYWRTVHLLIHYTNKCGHAYSPWLSFSHTRKKMKMTVLYIQYTDMYATLRQDVRARRYSPNVVMYTQTIATVLNVPSRYWILTHSTMLIVMSLQSNRAILHSVTVSGTV